MRPVPLRFPVALVVALLLALLAAAPAGALSVTDVTVIPRAPAGPLPPSGPGAAGAHPDLFTRFTFSDAGTYTPDTARALVVDFAPGVVAYVNHVEQCTAAQFAADSDAASTCPAGSSVGTAVTGLTTDNGLVNTLLGGRVEGTIYNIAPPPGAPAALGIDIAPPAANPHIKVVATIGVDAHDLGLTASLSLPNTAMLAPLGLPLARVNVHTDWIEQTLFGYVNGRSFFTNPTACIPAAIAVSASSYSGASGAGSGSYTPTDCANVPFSTRLGIAVDPPLTDWTSTVSSNVQPGEADIPRANSHVRGTTVVLPQSLLLNPALAARLDACTDAQFALRDTSVEARCPASSAVGEIEFVSPILGSFPGKAYFGSQTPTERLRLFLDVPLYGAHIKVSARVLPSRTTGQITTIFSDLPQIAFTDFTLTFHGGPRSALVSPTECGTHTATAVTTPWSGTAAQAATGSFTVSWDGRGAPCPHLFGPSMETAVSDPQAGGSPDFTLVAHRPDRHVPVGRMTYDLPHGLTGNLALRGLAKCSLEDAAAARCPASSRLGPVLSVDGSGTEPPALPGDVFLTEPKVAGDPAGLSVAVPATLGPVDAGIVIVGVRLTLRPDGGLRVVSDPIPALQEGIPLAIRKLTVTVDRDGFLRNPTGCGDLSASGRFESLRGQVADAGSSLRIEGCDRLRFRPRMRVIAGGRRKVRRGAHPRLITVIRAQGDDAAIRKAHVRLPKAFATNLRAVEAACSPEDFAAGRCSKRARTARAIARSPLIGEPVRGWAWLVDRPEGEVGLPRLVVRLRHPIAVQFEGIVKVGKRGAIATTFPLLPDLPLTRFALRFRGGRFGALEATRPLCKARRRLRLPAGFRGWNGDVARTRPRIGVRGCKKAKRGRRR